MPPFSPTPRTFCLLPGQRDCSQLTLEALQDLSVVRPDVFRNPEAYRITISEERITIEMGGKNAFRHAWKHFEQWRGNTASHTPCGVLEDWPAMAHRGFMLDISRCKIPTMAQFRTIIDQLSALRYNELQLYTEHSFAYTGHETVWKDASPITSTEIGVLREWCRNAGITLVPNQNSFGHFERWLKHPEYRELAECANGFRSPWGDWRDVGSVLRPCRASETLVHELHDQLLPLFEGTDRFNIGCDETFELGQGLSKIQCDAKGRQAVYADVVSALADRVAQRYGMRCQFWADILIQDPVWLERLRPDMIALNWGYEAEHPFGRECRQLQAAGLEFYVCPGTSSWNSFAGRSNNMLANIEQAIRTGLQHGAKGMLLTDWGDNGHLQPWEVSLPAIRWAAALAWNPETACRPQEDEWLALGRICDDLSWQPGNANALFRMFTTEIGENLVPTPELQTLLDRIRRWETADARQAQILRNLALGAVSELRRRSIPTELESDWKDAPQEHIRLWKERNREGGLAESTGWYKTSAQLCDIPKEFLIP